jgi:hypothetical protein
MKKLFWFLFTLPFMLLPTELFILFWLILKPITFWQRLISIALGAIFLSTIQSILFVVWLAFLKNFFTWLDQENRQKKYTKFKQEATQKNRIEEWL